MFRLPALALIAISLGLGPNYFQQRHIDEVNRAWAKYASPKVAANGPLKPMPSGKPVHDPATCPVCMALHVAAAAPSAPLAILRLQWSGASFVVHPDLCISFYHGPAQCRGPPVA